MLKSLLGSFFLQLFMSDNSSKSSSAYPFYSVVQSTKMKYSFPILHYANRRYDGNLSATFSKGDVSLWKNFLGIVQNSSEQMAETAIRLFSAKKSVDDRTFKFQFYSWNFSQYYHLERLPPLVLTHE